MTPAGRPPSTTPGEWVQAALDLIEESGVNALAVEAVARRLGVSKGGFYWYFDDRRALLRAALEEWEARHVTGLAARFDAIDDPRERLHRLLHYATIEIAPTILTQLMAAGDDPDVAPALTRAAGSRLALLGRLFADLGLAPAAARHRAALTYSAFLGLVALRAQAPDVLGSTQRTRAYLRELERLLLHDSDPPEWHG